MPLKDFFFDTLLWLWRLMVILLISFLLRGSTVPLSEAGQQVQRYTRDQEFDFLGWMVDSVGVKLEQWSVGSSSYLSQDDRRNLVLEYIGLVGRVANLENALADIYAAPTAENPDAAASKLSQDLARARARMAAIQPVFEEVLAQQVSVVLADLGLQIGGEVFPPVAFHFTRVPVALIVSPRDEIRQVVNIQLDAELSLEEKMALEELVETKLDMSALVVPVGGLGTYPTMIQESSTLSWVVETIVHEWVHNYLTFRPLGLFYSADPELRTMNETVASILGTEMGEAVLERYYPEYLPPPVEHQREKEEAPPEFDFRAEMRQTRVSVDQMLEEGRIEEAEAYMEARRLVFWEHGYRIRKINQAYFAFYGAYADEPGGAAGEDPVGAAVRRLWERIKDPARFLHTMAWMNEFSDLESALGQ